MTHASGGSYSPLQPSGTETIAMTASSLGDDDGLAAVLLQPRSFLQKLVRWLLLILWLQLDESEWLFLSQTSLQNFVSKPVLVIAI